MWSLLGPTPRPSRISMVIERDGCADRHAPCVERLVGVAGDVWVASEVPIEEEHLVVDGVGCVVIQRPGAGEALECSTVESAVGGGEQPPAVAAVGLDQANGLLDPAFLVRRDGEAEVPGLDRLGVLGEHDAPTRQWDPLDAGEDPHERILAFSGSNTPAAPAIATVTG